MLWAVGHASACLAPTGSLALPKARCKSELPILRVPKQSTVVPSVVCLHTSFPQSRRLPKNPQTAGPPAATLMDVCSHRPRGIQYIRLLPQGVLSWDRSRDRQSPTTEPAWPEGCWSACRPAPCWRTPSLRSSWSSRDCWSRTIAGGVRRGTMAHFVGPAGSRSLAGPANRRFTAAIPNSWTEKNQRRPPKQRPLAAPRGDVRARSGISRAIMS
jgi:hypothetical protein